MLHQFTVTLHSCGSCVSHSHCNTCCEQAEEALRQKPYIQSVSLDPVKKILTLASAEDRDSLADLLDDMGLFTKG